LFHPSPQKFSFCPRVLSYPFVSSLLSGGVLSYTFEVGTYPLLLWRRFFSPQLFQTSLSSPEPVYSPIFFRREFPATPLLPFRPLIEKAHLRSPCAGDYLVLFMARRIPNSRPSFFVFSRLGGAGFFQEQFPLKFHPVLGARAPCNRTRSPLMTSPPFSLLFPYINYD